VSPRSWLIYFRTLRCRSNGSINYTARTIVRLYVSLGNRAEWRATNLFWVPKKSRTTTTLMLSWCQQSHVLRFQSTNFDEPNTLSVLGMTDRGWWCPQESTCSVTCVPSSLSYPDSGNVTTEHVHTHRALKLGCKNTDRSLCQPWNHRRDPTVQPIGLSTATPSLFNSVTDTGLVNGSDCACGSDTFS
jgi:hypothetical protein